MGAEGGSDGEKVREGQEGRKKCGLDEESEEEGRQECRVCVWEREEDHGGVGGSGVCGSTSGLSV